MSRRVLPVGERGLLVECADLDEVRALAARLGERPLDGQREVVPAARTVLVLASGSAARDRLREPLRDLATGLPPDVGLREVVVDTVYDGADLEEVARLTGRSVDGVVAWHAATPWTVGFVGFAPGFAYLVDAGPDGGRGLDVPRRATPRPAVPAGSVAVGGPYSAVYPRRSPGGWQLLGRTRLEVWDVDRDPPALLVPGTSVRFRPVREVVRGAGGDSDSAGRPGGAGDAGARGGRGLEVEAVGVQALVEDLGRPGLLALGVPVSGALDRGAAVRANHLVGNDAGAAVIECVLGGLAVRATGRQVLALTGATAPARVSGPDGSEVVAPHDAPFALPDGHVLRLDEPVVGMRTYVAVRGGLDLPPVLGSRSTDVLSGLGPPPLRPGTRLPVGDAALEAVAGWPDDGPGVATEVVVRLRPGPRDDWLAPPGLARLADRPWTVSNDSNRVGLRLVGDRLDRVDGELASEGVVVGAVQVPPSGQPLVFLADHAVTGGYPVVGVVHPADLDVLAQVRPGAVVRFAVVGAVAGTPDGLSAVARATGRAADGGQPAGTDPPAG